MTIDNIKAVFGDCCMKSTTCNKQTSYLLQTENKFYIKDQGDQLPIAICTEQEAELIVVRQGDEDIWVIKTDSCLIPHDTSKCDCLVLNSSKLYLVELKTSCKNKRSVARREAALQLSNTLDLLRDNGVVITQKDIQAIICFRSEKTYPVMASRNAARAKIYEKYRVWLNEGNEISL